MPRFAGRRAASKGLELVWVDDPVDAYFLQVQGSGVVNLAEGGTIRLGYDGANGRPYMAIGRLLVERGEVPLKEMTMARLHDWIAAHGEAGAALMQENPSYVLSRKYPAMGPMAAKKVVLAGWPQPRDPRRYIFCRWACRSGSVPRRERFVPGTVQPPEGRRAGHGRRDPRPGARRPLLAAAAIRRAGEAGAMNAGRYYLLVPRRVAARADARRKAAIELRRDRHSIFAHVVT